MSEVDDDRCYAWSVFYDMLGGARPLYLPETYDTEGMTLADIGWLGALHRELHTSERAILDEEIQKVLEIFHRCFDVKHHEPVDIADFEEVDPADWWKNQ